jgi:hypothetical protein
MAPEVVGTGLLAEAQSHFGVVLDKRPGYYLGWVRGEVRYERSNMMLLLTVA